ncbi:MAG: InlB B-repeat-containing protein, partial [Eubacteriales bacterium]|nr:InlB B-repeat-containing protein [Eubacteriales bacterium]
MSKRFLSVILAICIGLTAVAIIQFKPWQHGQTPATISGDTQDQGRQDPLDRPVDPAASEPSFGQEPGVDPSGEIPDIDPTAPAEPEVPLGQSLETGIPVDPLLPASPGSGAVKLSTRVFTIHFDTNGGSSLEAIQVREGSRLGGLPVPYRADSIFLGWYYDSSLNNRVSDSHVIRSSLTLYAQYTDTAPLLESETPRAATLLDQPQDFTFVVVATAGMSIDQVKAAIQAKNLNNPSETGFFELSELPGQSPENEIQYLISGRDGLFATGATYKFTLEDEQLRYAGYGQSVRDYNFTIFKKEVMNLSLNAGLIYISVEEISNFMVDGQASDSLSIPLATTDLGTIDFTSGSFDYDLTDLAVGQAVAIYKGVRPDERSINDESGEGEVAYITITAVQGKTCQFVNAAAQDVLFTPDILPLNRDDDLDGQADNDSVQVEKSVLDFASGDYAVLGLDDETTVDVGDFLAFYTGTMNSPDGQATYGRILSVESEGEWYTLDYEVVSLETMRSVMDLYDNKGVSGDQLLEGVDPSDLESSIEQQARQSGFAEEAATYLAALTLETEEFTTLQGDFDLAGYNIVLDDGTPLSPGDMQLMSGSKVEVDITEIKATINKRLVHFEGLEGLRLTLKIGIEIKISTGEESEIVIGVTGYFEQEVRVSINASGGAVWKWWGIFPYIDEYRLNANIDLYEYTGIQIEATIATKEKDEELDTDDAGENLAKQLKDLLDARDKYVGDDEQTVADGLNEKYAAMLENESDWVELFSQNIFEQEGSVDPFHILVYEINLKFVVSANMNISIGCDFYYENAKRYNYSIGVFQKTCTTETIDLVEEHYEFTFYVMGTMGLRAGLKFEIKVGVFSTKLASLGISAEVGAYVRVWGYFYYEL